MLTRRSPIPNPSTPLIARGAMLGDDPLLPAARTRTSPTSHVATPLRDIDVVLRFSDGTEVVILTQARHPLRAVMAAIPEAERTIGIERLLGVKSIEFR